MALIIRRFLAGLLRRGILKGNFNVFLKNRGRRSGSNVKPTLRGTKSRNLNYPADSHFSISHLAAGDDKKSVAICLGIWRDASLTRFITRAASYVHLDETLLVFHPFASSALLLPAF